MEGYEIKHENPETRLIREQNRCIRTLEEQLDVCREQLKAQELLLEEQNKVLALFAEALDFKFLPCYDEHVKRVAVLLPPRDYSTIV